MQKNVYPKEYYEFFIKFNEGDFYTCHDLLEEMWMTEKSKLFLKGLLQMTVALYHYSYGNVEGTRMMMEKALDYLDSYRPSHWGLDLEKVISFIHECLHIIPKETTTEEDRHRLPPLPVLLLFLEE